MDLLKIINAYEMLRSQGLVIPSNQLGNGSNTKRVTHTANTTEETHGKDRNSLSYVADLLRGNTTNQQQFLKDLRLIDDYQNASNRSEKSIRVKETPDKQQNLFGEETTRATRQEVHDGIRFSPSDQPSDGEKNKEQTYDNQAEVNVPVMEQSDSVFHNMKISEILEMKETVQEIYGEGVFETAVGENIAAILPLVEARRKKISDDAKINQEGRVNQPVEGKVCVEKKQFQGCSSWR